MKFLIVIFTLIPLCGLGAISNDVLLNKEKIFFYTPHLVNQKYFALEFGFQSLKKINSLNYPFNAFAKAFLAEEYYLINPNWRAGALGFKGGVMLPTQPWIPLSLVITGGYAKTALHEDPWFGKRAQSQETDDMFLIEGGLNILYKDILLRYTYQLNTIDYFKRKSFLSIGVNF
jgi:hypothetical protein